MAYQGFASGDVARDAFAVRKFLQDGHEIALAQSFAKNMGLYGERAGAFSLITKSKKEMECVLSQLKIIVRPMYSNPPIHGARIVAEILGDPELKSHWWVSKTCRRLGYTWDFTSNKILQFQVARCKTYGRQNNWCSNSTSGSLKERRFHKELVTYNRSNRNVLLHWTPAWSSRFHIKGNFTFSIWVSLKHGFFQVERLTKEFSVYLTKDGRISMAGVTSKNVAYLAKAIHEVTKW